MNARYSDHGTEVHLERNWRGECHQELSESFDTGLAERESGIVPRAVNFGADVAAADTRYEGRTCGVCRHRAASLIQCNAVC